MPVTIDFPPVGASEEGPKPGETVATAGVIHAGQYSQPIRLTGLSEVWLKWTATTTEDVIIDTLLSRKVSPAVAASLVVEKYTGHELADTLGQLKLDSQLSGKTSRRSAHQLRTYWFRLRAVPPSTSGFAAVVAAHQPSWDVVLRISDPGAVTDWVEPPVSSAVLPYPFSNTGAPVAPWFDGEPQTLFSASSSPYAPTTAHQIRETIRLLWQVGSRSELTVDFTPTEYAFGWEWARVGGPTQTHASVSVQPSPPALDRTIAWTSNPGNLAGIGWRCTRSEDPFSDAFNGVTKALRWDFTVGAFGTSLISMMRGIGPSATYDLSEAVGIITASGREPYGLTDAGTAYVGTSFLFEDDVAELLGVEIQPDCERTADGQRILGVDTYFTEATGRTTTTPSSQPPPVVQLYVQASRSSNQTELGGSKFLPDPPGPGLTTWGPVTNPGAGEPEAALTGWLKGGSGPAEAVAQAIEVCTYDGSVDAPWYEIDEETWQTALARESVELDKRLELYGQFGSYARVSGMTFFYLPDDALGPAPITSMPPIAAPDDSRSTSRSWDGLGINFRITTKPSRFKIKLAPVIQSADPDYDPLPTNEGAIGTSRRTFGRPPEARE